MSFAERVTSGLARVGPGLFLRQRILRASAAILIAACIAGCSSPNATTAAKHDPITLRIGVAIPKSSDPNAGVRSLISNQTSEQFIGLGWDGQPAQRVASSWKLSPDGRELTLTLNKNVQFHDGTKIDAPFLEPGLKEFLDNSSLNYKSRKSIVDVAAISEDELRIRLSRPESLLLADLSNFLISHPTDQAVGVGPYKLLPGKPVRLEAFDQYYRGRPQIDNVEIHEFDQQRSAWAALLRNEIDAVHEISPDAMTFLEAEGQTAVQTFAFTRPYFISLIFSRTHPILKQVRVRQALSYAVDRQNIIKQGLNGKGTPADGPVWPFHWAYSSAPRTYSYNLEAATIGLDSAGLRPKKATQEDPMPSRFRFKCLTVSKFEKIALALQSQLAELGVDLEVQTVSSDELIGHMKAADFDAILMEQTSGRSLAWTYMMFHSSNFRSLGYKSADKSLDRIRDARSDSEVRAAVSDFQQEIFDDPPAIFLAWPQVARVVSPKFNVQEPDGKGRDVISTLWLWKPVGAGQ